MIIIVLLFVLIIAGWVSYYTSASIYRSLVKNDNKYARAFQVLALVLMFGILLALIFYFIANSLAFER